MELTLSWTDLFESLPDAVLIHDCEGIILDGNDVACAWLGYSKKELIGMELQHIYSRLDAKEIPQRIHQLLHQKHTLHDTSFITKKGFELVCEVQAQRIQGHTPPLILSIMRDVSERNRLTQTLSMERERLEEARKVKSDFLARVSHELRTPMNGILAGAELAIQCETLEEIREMLDIIMESSLRLTPMLEQILDFSKIASSKKIPLVPVAFSLREFLTKRFREYVIQAERKGLDFQILFEDTLPHQITIDKEKLYISLANVVGNALKFTRTGSVRVLVCAIWDGTHLEFQIQDTGIGIPETKADKIFEPFEQLEDPMTREFEGIGLGLPLAKELVEMMGGSIFFRSKQGEGSTFFIRVPLGNG